MFKKNKGVALACAAFLGVTGAISPMTLSDALANAPYAKVDGSYRMLDGSVIDGVVARGIDVSHWKGDIDWNAVAADDIQFAMLGTTYAGGVDPKFSSNALGASTAGLKVGAYLYSYATTPQMASDEADFILDLIKDYPISYPVVFDAESSALGALSPQEVSKIINTFCEKIEDAGYHPMVYANDYWLSNKIDLSQMNYDVWVARYELKHVFADPVMWQATQTGSVAGVNGNVDIDFQYKDLSKNLPANRWRTIGEKTYYYKDYLMQKNTWIDDGTNWFYIGSDAQAEKGWKKLDEIYYYLDETTGQMVTGWMTKDHNTYYLRDSGAMAAGWVDDRGFRYFMNSDGTMKTGWHKAEGKDYYLDPSSGKMAVGWSSINNSWYYFNQEGQKQTGELNLDGTMYYLDQSSGIMAADTTIEHNGIQYKVDSSGVCTQIVPEETSAAIEETTAESVPLPAPTQESTASVNENVTLAGPGI